jgi:hypothetical protein
LVLQGIADYQNRKFVHDGEQGFLKSGLWKKSRHPSFVVEVFVWWGFAVAAIFSLGFSWDLILGAIFSTVYLLGMRALLEDRAFAKKEGFEQYKKDVAMYYAPFTLKRKPEEKEEPVEEVVVLADGFDDSEIEEAMAAPAVVLADIDYDKNDLGAIVVGVGDGVEVVGVVWPEKRRRHKVYKYDPNGESLKEGDIVLVPSRDVAKNRDIIRKATVVYENYHIESDKLNKPLKKIIAVVKNTSK